MYDKNGVYFESSILIIEGTALIIGGGIVVVALLTTPRLAKQYPLIVAQQATALMIGLSMFLAGIGRIIILAFGAEPSLPIMLLVISLDRLLSLVVPMTYFKSSFKLQIIQLSISQGILAPIVLQVWILAFTDTVPNKDSVCWINDVMQEYHTIEFFSIKIITSMLSVVFYLIAYVLWRKKAAKVDHFGEAQRVFEERQRQLTFTMLITCLFTVVFYAVPSAVVFITHNTKDSSLEIILRWYGRISEDITCLVIILILYFKQPDIAKAIKNMFRCIKSVHRSGTTVVC